MSRTDLLALTSDDLAAITNRGTVKRAERELEAGSPTFTIEESAAGELTVAWSDGIVCRFPAGKTLHEATCSSGIVGISRHIVRSVLAYQEHMGKSAAPEAEVPGGETPLAAASPAAAWDPGSVSDDELVARFRAAAVNKARQRLAQGILVELARGAKPLARFLDEPCTLRFLVPGDVRYVTADCAESLLALYVPLAVWAFRQLPADRAAGLVAIQQAELPVPSAVLTELDGLLAEFVTDGAAGCAASWSQRLTRLEAALRDAGLVWPAELVADLLHHHAMYAAHDARFDPLELVPLIGELIARCRAITHRTSAVPQLLIRGTRSDRVTEIAGGRLVGLGVGVRPGRRTVTLSAYLQDADSGSVMAVERAFPDPPQESLEPPKSFTDLASTVLTRGLRLTSLGNSQLLLKSGKRTPSGRLVLPRTAASLTAHPQAYAWEQLKPPAAAESFAELALLLESRPPSYLRPRRLTENLHVCPVQRVVDVAFDPARQRLTAVLRDHHGGEALLVHPFHSRGREGFDALAGALQSRAADVRFVCGHVTCAARSLVIHPIQLILEQGGNRTGIQPWVTTAAGPAVSFVAEEHAAEPTSPLESFCDQLRFELSELLLSGLRRTDGHTARAWSDLAQHGQRVGFVKFVEPISRLAGLLALKSETLRWNPAPAADVVIHLCLYCRVLADSAVAGFDQPSLV